jgi:hypothetical protein
MSGTDRDETDEVIQRAIQALRNTGNSSAIIVALEYLHARVKTQNARIGALERVNARAQSLEATDLEGRTWIQVAKAAGLYGPSPAAAADAEEVTRKLTPVRLPAVDPNTHDPNRGK